MGREASPPGELRWIAGFVPGGSPSRLEVAVHETPGGAATLVVLSDAGRFSRVLLGRIPGCPGDRSLVAVKLPRDTYRIVASGVAASALDNRELEAMWRRERAHHRAARSPHVLELIDVGIDELPPTAHCLATGRSFRLRCPETLDELEVCRDDALLREHDLEPFSTSTERYLYSPARSRREPHQAPVFYTTSTSAGADARGAEIQRPMALFAAGQRAVAAAGEADRERMRATDADWLAVHAAAEPMAERILTLAFYGGPTLVTPLLPLHFDELARLLGGADPAAALRADAVNPRTRSAALALGRSDQFFWRRSGGPRFALECLNLKVAAFLQLCRGLLEHYEHNGVGHFAVQPGSILVDLGAAAMPSPQRWRFTVKLADLGALHSLRLPGMPESIAELLLPSIKPDAGFESPLLAAESFGRELKLHLQVAAGSSTDGSLAVRCPRQRAAETIAAGDVVRVTPLGVPAMGEGPWFGTATATSSETLELELVAPDSADRGELGAIAFDAVVAAFPRPGPALDLAGLGTLLLRTLLVNDVNDAAAVDHAVRLIVAELELADAARRGGDPVPRIRARLARAGEVLAPANVVWASRDRSGMAEFVEPTLWQDLLGIGLRMLCCRGPAALRTRVGLEPDEPPEAALAEVVAEIEDIAACLHIELFGAESRHREIEAICAEIRDAINEALVGEGPRTEAE